MDYKRFLEIILKIKRDIDDQCHCLLGFRVEIDDMNVWFKEMERDAGRISGEYAHF